MKKVYFILILFILIFSSNESLAENLQVITRLCIGDTLDNFGYNIESAGDINDDGFNDVWVIRNFGLHPLSGKVSLYLFYGGDPMDSIPDFIINDTIYTVKNIGDMSGDNFDDFIIYLGGTVKRYALYYGGPIFDTIPEMIFPVINQDEINFGFQASVVGGVDMDGDGNSDLVFGEPGSSTDFPGKAYFYGSIPTMDTIPDIEFTSLDNYPEYYEYSLSIDYVSNLDGNSYLTIGEKGNGQLDVRGRVYLFKICDSNGVFNFNNIHDIIIETPSTATFYGFGSLLKNLGDLDNNGFEDLVISATSSSYAYIYQGGLEFDTLPDVTIVPQFERLEPIGDVNNDTYPDFLIGEQPFNGRAVIYYGGEDFDGNGDVNVNFLGYLSNNFGKSIKGLGDVNGDGIDDFGVGALVDEYDYWAGEVFIYAGFDTTIVDVNNENENILPSDFYLQQNYPNPFNSSTQINYDLPSKSDVTLSIFNILGQKVYSADYPDMTAGMHTASWNGVNSNGGIIPSGVYFYQIKTSDFSDMKKMILLK